MTLLFAFFFNVHVSYHQFKAYVYVGWGVHPGLIGLMGEVAFNIRQQIVVVVVIVKKVKREG